MSRLIPRATGSVIAGRSAAPQTKRFLDRVRLWCRAGNGGPGYPRMGGRGGRGGHVYLTPNPNTTLKELVKLFETRRVVAGSGKASGRRQLVGEFGDDVTVDVPLGIVVANDDDVTLCELNAVGDRYLAARGGAGGDATNGFRGIKGEFLAIRLYMKLISDATLLGYPNAGKSSILQRLSGARTAVSAFPFSTRSPALGTLCYPDGRRISVSDLPGLMDGATRSRTGLGARFLRHAERAKLLVYVVDVDGFRASVETPHRNAFQCLALLCRELENYWEGLLGDHGASSLLGKPAVLVVNKMDSLLAELNLRELRDSLSRGLSDPTLLGLSLSDPSMSDPSLSDPSLSDPSLSDPSLSDSSLSDPSLSDPSLSDSSLSDPSLSDSSLSDCLPSRLPDFRHIIPVSTVTGRGLNELKEVLRDDLDLYIEAGGEYFDTTPSLSIDLQNKMLRATVVPKGAD